MNKLCNYLSRKEQEFSNNHPVCYALLGVGIIFMATGAVWALVLVLEASL